MSDTQTQRQLGLDQDIAWLSTPRLSWRPSADFDQLDFHPPPELIPISSDDEEEDESDRSGTEEDNDMVNVMVDTPSSGWGIDFDASVEHKGYEHSYWTV